ncbi:hypothetical protein EYC84_005919 [Monilinia fructicola]|nr:hypothetical protein EYC84_005919 [Monilinia fructicola]
MNATEFDLHQKMFKYQPLQEKYRKDFLEGVFTRTKEEAREEESLMVELKRILARSEKFMEERKELYARLDAPPSSSNISPYTTSQGLYQLLQQLMTADKSKKKKAMPEGQTPGGSTPVAANTPGGFDRRDSNVRESVSGPSGAAGNTSATSNKKGSISSSSQNPSERRRLTEEEERIYGVSHHDRLTGGPFFRGDKATKPMTAKSTIQQTRIKSVLVELGISEKPSMATADVAHGYDELFKSIGILLDSRKVVDKLAAEVSLLKEQVEEKKRRIAGALRSQSSIGGVDGAGDEREEKGENGNTGDATEAESKEAGVAPIVSTTEQEDGKNEISDAKDIAGANGNGDVESNGGNDDASAAAHKRSASVLSTGSNKSLKRQKK